jgi:hypothetical protein
MLCKTGSLTLESLTVIIRLSNLDNLPRSILYL